MCNRSCTWCPNVYDLRKTGETMSMLTVMLLISQLNKINYKGEISPFANNEPLMDNRIFDIIDLLKYNFPENEVVIHTNGDRLFDKEVFKRFCDSKLDRVIINCYDGMDRYNELHELLGIKGKDSYNYGKFFKYGKNIELRLTTQPLPHFWNRGGSVDLTPAIKEKYCFIPFQWCTVNCKGEVYLCCGDWKNEVVMGNIYDKTIDEIWNSPKYQKYREYHLKEQGKLLPLCDKCNRI